MNKKSRISEAFAGRKAFVAFLTGGDPDVETTEKLIPVMAEAGADVIEIGIPFSDPVAEGPVIQAADERALSAGCTTDKLFDMVARVRDKTSVPLLFMTYLNPIFTYGAERFFQRCSETGIDGVIVPDMPFEEKSEIASSCSKFGVELVSLIAPTSRDRIRKIAAEAEGFIYCVSSLGVTGVRSEIKSDVTSMIEQVRAVTDVPCAVGFGVSRPEHAEQLGAVADGVIVGSAIVKIIAENGHESALPVSDFIRSMRAALDKN
ncbi:MAG: tryptophan synthase alpha chain [Clostridiales bacterium]|jgi:tryptophan synthase alpha chain|nr:tryptophan synthase subunit alpha [Eubacteriales bacterium]MDD3504336.1 tryptophan synthase subunit alpha [Eubacteriales bacterium]MDD4682772.1 tryptophan synthase subunit alpha [Eubacteriales bacterium]MDN5315686.1 tryptophan synthase alpha chain [Clostridiales bacterium]